MAERHPVLPQPLHAGQMLPPVRGKLLGLVRRRVVKLIGQDDQDVRAIASCRDPYARAPSRHRPDRVMAGDEWPAYGRSISSRFCTGRRAAPGCSALPCRGRGLALAGVELRAHLAQGAARRRAGRRPSSKLALQIGLDANISGMHSATKSASNPKSDSYGKYPSLSTLAEQVRRDVLGAERGRERLQVPGDHGQDRRDPPAGERDHLDRQGAEDVRHEVGGLPHVLGQPARGAAGEHAEAAQGDEGERRRGRRHAADRQPRLVVAAREPAAGRVPARAAAGPTTGARPRGPAPSGPSCVGTTYPSALASSEGLFPNQILTAYGIAPLQAAGLRGQGRGSRSSARRPRRPRTSTSSATASARREPR